MIVELIGGPMDGAKVDRPDGDRWFQVAATGVPPITWPVEEVPYQAAALTSLRRGTYRLEERDETAPPRMYWQGWDDEPVPVVPVDPEPMRAHEETLEYYTQLLTAATEPPPPVHYSTSTFRNFLREFPMAPLPTSPYEARWTDEFHPVVPEEEPF